MRSADDWRRRAACRDAGVEMNPVPGDGPGLRQAKQVCAGCPVQVKCLLDAERLAAQDGEEPVQGVWGGLTAQERATMAGLGRDPAPCTSCGLDCVPANLSTKRCPACYPQARIVYDDYRPLIEEQIALGRTPPEIAERLRLHRNSVIGACKRWQLTVQPRRGGPGSRRARTDVLPCGTLAAKVRHQRRQKDSWRHCPLCRLVPWVTSTTRHRAA